MKRVFSKPALTYTQQVVRLRDRGMVVEDEAEAEFYLQHLNYYRLGAYWLPFEADHATHQFRPGTRFEAVLNLYVFDRELRLLMMDAIERVEVSVRSQWAYQLAHHHGPHAHLDPNLARRPDWNHNLAKLSEGVSRSDETFIQHLTSTYTERLPPVWAVCEVMSLGQLSRWYDALRPKRTRRAIADVFGTDEHVLQSWLHHLTLVRNLCAHHSRLWNREFTVTLEIPRTKPGGLGRQLNAGSRKVYNALVVLLYCMDVIAPRHHFRQRFSALIARHTVDVERMGFPEGWRGFPIWQQGAA